MVYFIIFLSLISLFLESSNQDLQQILMKRRQCQAIALQRLQELNRRNDVNNKRKLQAGDENCQSAMTKKPALEQDIIICDNLINGGRRALAKQELERTCYFINETLGIVDPDVKKIVMNFSRLKFKCSSWPSSTLNFVVKQDLKKMINRPYLFFYLHSKKIANEPNAQAIITFIDQEFNKAKQDFSQRAPKSRDFKIESMTCELDNEIHSSMFFVTKDVELTKHMLCNYYVNHHNQENLFSVSNNQYDQKFKDFFSKLDDFLVLAICDSIKEKAQFKSKCALLVKAYKKIKLELTDLGREHVATSLANLKKSLNQLNQN
jgi:hypothetical protein